MCDWPRLFSCPGRPHLFARCRAHKVHFLEGGGCAYPKLTFTIDIYCATGHASSICRRVTTDSHTIYGQGLYDWDCSFVDSDRFVIAYRESYFGQKTLCLLMYDISRRQFRTCNLTAEDYLDDDEEGYGYLDLGPATVRGTAEETVADYMLKRDRLFIISPPHNVVDFRMLTCYRLSWPLEKSMTLTPLWEPKPELRMRVRAPDGFNRRRFLAQASFLTEDDVLCVFDGEGVNQSTFTVTYNRFFSIDLQHDPESGICNSTWTRCSPDIFTNTFPRQSTVTNMKHIVYCNWKSILYMWNSPSMWNLTPPCTMDMIAAGDVEAENMASAGDWQWNAYEIEPSSRLRAMRLSWPPPITSFAVNWHGGIYELDNNDIDDGGAPRFVGYVGKQNGPPPLAYLSAIALFDSWRENTLQEFFMKSISQLRSRGQPFCLAHLAFIKH